MSRIDVDNVLSQMRTMAAQAKGVQAPDEVSKSGGFSDLFAQSVNKVNDTQMQAGALTKAFDSGQSDLDIGQVMVALQKANVSFQAMVQVRNKLVDAYKDVMNMPV